MDLLTTKLHHVVYCVRPENQDRAAAFWRELGVTFEEVALPELGLRILLDWSAGIEVISPTEPEGSETARFQAFLAEQGEGVYSVVVRTPSVDGPIDVAAAYGAEVRFQRHSERGDDVTDEADLSPVLGMAVTFLATTKPD